MINENCVYDKVYKEYGRVVLTLGSVLREKNMNVYRLSRLTGINWGIVQRYVDGKIYRVDLDLLSRMCFVLDCSLDDLLHYEAVNCNNSKKSNNSKNTKTLMR